MLFSAVRIYAHQLCARKKRKLRNYLDDLHFDHPKSRCKMHVATFNTQLWNSRHDVQSLCVYFTVIVIFLLTNSIGNSCSSFDIVVIILVLEKVSIRLPLIEEHNVLSERVRNFAMFLGLLCQTIAS